jgi:hypothetical protein
MVLAVADVTVDQPRDPPEWPSDPECEPPDPDPNELPDEEPPDEPRRLSGPLPYALGFPTVPDAIWEPDMSVVASRT